MEKLASLHHAVTDEAWADSEPETIPSYRLFFPELDRKKRLSAAWIPFIFLTIALFIVSLASPVLALRKGNSGSDVNALQKSLQEDGYFDGPVTGYYGLLTQDAVIRFQKAKGLSPDGIVGSETRSAIESGSSASNNNSSFSSEAPTTQDFSPVSPADSFVNLETPTTPESRPPSDDTFVNPETPSPEFSAVTPPPGADRNEAVVSARPSLVLTRGNRSSQVTSLQKNLQIGGYFEGPITGYYGSTTQEAVIRFQKAKGLTPDGLAGPKTRAAMESGSPVPMPALQPAPSPTVTDDRIGFANPGLVLRRGHRNSDVTALQKKLLDDGYFNGPLTGYYGSMTQEAVMKFQKAKGLTPDGIVGSNTRIVLESGSQTSTSSQPDSSDSVFNEDSFIDEQNEDSSLNEQNEQEPFNQDLFINEQSQQDTTQENESSLGTEMTLKETISGKISPKSIVHSGQGLFFAQNMMYSHTITVYDRKYKLVKTLADTVNLEKYGYSKFTGKYQGAPVEAAFSHNGQYAWISNYQMYGSGFNKPGSDQCTSNQKTDNSFLYRVNTNSLEIDQVVEVGSVPKFVATSPDNRLVLVSNWCSWDLSVVDPEEIREIKRIKLGRYPRGIVVDSTSEKAYVAVMGSYDIAVVDLNDFSVDWLKNIGHSPRHLSIDPTGQYLYATLNSEGMVAKIDLSTGKVLKKVATGSAPRSMVISDDGQLLYVVNYHSNTVSKVRTTDMKVLQTVNTNANPIGITYDPKTRQVWVACYSGSIMVFQD
ncbi:peptidoglycan-binding protein [Coleofasciculus sp. LEGE 07092]|uniref:peptidoglycan-binding protein n=1 Tax=Coleofasciculus sp. LEGE 07092 TaxID=2777969 RepID=UPI00187F93A7|nr:peptidoglycan-binding protein [Coleofasciculus sp. LEGE 07092]MBE9147573.1 peptidoglycan-binding protein [Coleofasciculus sp. LEGE 07092]